LGGRSFEAQLTAFPPSLCSSSVTLRIGRADANRTIESRKTCCCGLLPLVLALPPAFFSASCLLSCWTRRVVPSPLVSASSLSSLSAPPHSKKSIVAHAPNNQAISSRRRTIRNGSAQLQRGETDYNPLPTDDDLVVQVLPCSPDSEMEILGLDLLASREVAGGNLGVD
jgi:hypothetical protein